MLRCISLAKRASGYTKTNPRVGCVIIIENKILAEGWHQFYGGLHAEAHALSLISPELKHLLPLSTLYVTLEPCNHFGKTPPCSHAIVNAGIRKVYIGCEDPNPLVAGQGINFLQDAGIDVSIGLEKAACEQLIRPFVIAMQKNRPYIILKWAQSTDGFIGKKNESVWLSNSLSKRKVHQIRSEVDGILVGAGTVEADNPTLNTRFSMGRSAIKIVLDSNKGLLRDYSIFKSEEKSILISEHIDKYIQVSNVDFIATEGSPRINMNEWLLELKKRNIGTLLVEGGAEVLQSFIDAGFWDEAFIIDCPVQLQKGIKAPELKNHKLYSSTKLRNDFWQHFLNLDY